MRGLWAALIPATLIWCVMPSGLSPVRADDPPKPRTHVLTPEHNGKALKLRPGDTLVLKLPAQMPFWWASPGALPGLKAVGEPSFEEIKQPNPVTPALGRAKWYVTSYKVQPAFKGTEAEWLYCMLGKTKVEGITIKAEDALKPEQIPTKRGTYFRAKLELASP